MADSGYKTCPECGMMFRSAALFDKHRTSFCVGPMSVPPVKQYSRRSAAADEKVEELLELKNRRSKAREQREMAEKQLLSQQPDPSDRRRHNVYSAQSLDDQVNRLQNRLDHNKGVNQHGKQNLDETRDRLSSAKQAIEKQRAAIERSEQAIKSQLGRLAAEMGQPSQEPVQANTPPSRQELLISKALEEQRQRNLLMVQELQREIDQLRSAQNTPTRASGQQSPSLVADLQAIKKRYLESGGGDQEILRQINDTLAEAVAFESSGSSNQDGRQDVQPPDLAIQQKLMQYEMENQKILKEIEEQKLKLHHRDPEEEQMRKMQREHSVRMMALQQEMERLKYESQIQKLKQEILGPEYQPPAPMAAGISPAFAGGGLTASMPQMGPSAMQQPMGQTATLAPAPFDPAAGFYAFYDFLLNIDPVFRSARITVCMYREARQFTEESVLDLRDCLPMQTRPYMATGASRSYALIGSKQLYSRLQPSENSSLLIKVQAALSSRSAAETIENIGWAKIDLFDEQLRLNSGRWKLPLRSLPVRPELSVRECNTIPQQGDLELYYRLVNYRDQESQSAVQMAPSNASQYVFPALLNTYIAPIGGGKAGPPRAPFSGSGGSKIQYVPRDYAGGQSNRGGHLSEPPPPPTDLPPETSNESEGQYTERSKWSHAVPSLTGEPIPLSLALGYLKNVPPGEAKVRLTAYHRTTGSYVDSPFGPVTMISRSVLSTYMDNYHMFGKEQSRFDDITPEKDMILVARVYLRPQIEPNQDEARVYREESRILDDEHLAAWGVVPLMTAYGDVNAGTHNLPLYQVPCPDATEIPVTKDDFARARGFRRYGSAEISLSIYSVGSMPRVDDGESDEEYEPHQADDYSDMRPLERPFVLRERETPLSQPFVSGQGFDLYIDGARFLPDTVTISRVTGRIFDHRYSDKVVAQSLSTGIDLDSDIFNPVYNHRVEFRDIAFPPSSTLLVKLYTIDRHTRQLTIIGYSALNIFVESGTHKQPVNDALGTQISLNEGGHQLRIYHQTPDTLRPLSRDTLPDNHRFIPCASLLVRIVKASPDYDGKPMQAQRVPQSEHERLGLFERRPEYSSGVYFSDSARPTPGENKMLRSMAKRKYVTVREALSLIADGEERRLGTDTQIEAWIRNHLTRLMDTPPADHIIHHITPYLPHYGFKIACDGAMNLPWNKFTHVMMLLNPPAAFYYGGEYARYDRIAFTSSLAWDEGIKSPIWYDDFKIFRNRAFNSNLSFIIHLQEIEVKQQGKNFKYQLQEQAWSAVNVFSLDYVVTQSFQLPLIEGAPSLEVLQKLRQFPAKEVIRDLSFQKKIKLIEGASVFVRLADGRRHDELDPMVFTNTEYLPPDKASQYMKKLPSNPVRTLIPQGKEPTTFQKSLAKRFEELVDKLIDENDPYRLGYK